MNVIKVFHISFTGLKDGQHSFDFQIGKAFFEAFEEDRILDSDIKLKLFLDKSDSMLQWQFEFDGQIKTACDRCTLPFLHPVVFDEMLIVKFGPETIEESENVLVLDETEHEIRLEQYIFEFISVALPMRLAHPEDEEGNSDCDMTFLENYENEPEPDEDEIDPRWAALKNLKKE
jgi:uncharacterized metal-binding protein YceD (DUF177 family)